MHLLAGGQPEGPRDPGPVERADHAAPGGEPDVAGPVGNQAGHRVAVGNRPGQVDRGVDEQVVGGVADALQLPVAVDGNEAVPIVEEGVDTTEQAALRQFQ